MNKNLEFYNQCMETGRLPDMPNKTGLCGCVVYGFISKEFLNIFEPTDDDIIQLDLDNMSVGWWGSGVPPCVDSREDEKFYGFTPLRQTIVAFMCVITLEDFEKEVE